MYSTLLWYLDCPEEYSDGEFKESGNDTVYKYDFTDGRLYKNRTVFTNHVRYLDNRFLPGINGRDDKY